MTDRVKGCWVAFEQDIRTDDAEYLLNAIRMIKGVASVSTADTVSDFNDWSNREQLRREIGDVTTTVVRGLLNGDIGFVHDKTKVLQALQKLIKQLEERCK